MPTVDGGLRDVDVLTDGDPGASGEASPDLIGASTHLDAVMAADTSVGDITRGQHGVVEIAMDEEHMIEVAMSSDREALDLISDVLVNVSNPMVLALIMKNPAVSDNVKELMVWENERVPVDVLVRVARETRNPSMICALCARRRRDLAVVRALLENPYFDEVESHGDEMAPLARRKAELRELNVGSEIEAAALEELMESVSSGAAIADLKGRCEASGGRFVFDGMDHPAFSLEGEVLYMEIFGARLRLEPDMIGADLVADLQSQVFRENPDNLSRLGEMMRAVEQEMDKYVV